MSRRWLLGLALCPLVLVACATSTSATTTTSTAPVVPRGWTSHAYGRAAISVPSSWRVEREERCPGPGGAGVLVLGVPEPAAACPSIPTTRNYVVVSSPSGGAGVPNATGTARHTFGTVNGINVNIDTGPAPPTIWDIPSLDVRIVASGPDSNKVLHTIRPLEATFGSSTVILRIGDNCLGGVQWFEAHTSSTIPGMDSVIASSCTPAELTAALRSIHPGSTPREIADLERFTQSALCPKYAYLTLCKSGR
jgi:hypothetical protein